MIDYDLYIFMISSVLTIDAPEIELVDTFSSETQLAAYDPVNNRIGIKKSCELKLDLYFAIAHELRHTWQYKNNKEFYFKNYKKNTELSLNDYNLQLSEIDAIAFSLIIMDEFFQVQPDLSGLSIQVTTKIKKRIEYICSTL